MTDRLIWLGHLASKRNLTIRGMLLVVGGLAWLLIFLALPALVLVVVAFTQRGADGQIEWVFTTDNFQRLAGRGTFGWSLDTLRILWRSLVVATITTVACVGLAYPLAFFIATRSSRTRYFWLTLVIIPFCTNMVVRTYAWMLLMSAQLPPAQFLCRVSAGLVWVLQYPVSAYLWLCEQFPFLAAILAPETLQQMVDDLVFQEGSSIHPSMLAVYIGMITTLLPFTVMPIYTTAERLDWSIVEAATDLYATRRRIFLHAILPQTMPGLTVAIILTFIPAMGMFVVPSMLGGSKYMLVGDLIQQQFSSSRDYPFGAALSLVLMALTLLGLFLWRRKGAGGDVL